MTRTLSIILAATMVCSFSGGAAQLVVRSSADSGPFTLREALSLANEHDLITFDLPAGDKVIVLQSELYVRDISLTIDGLSQTGDADGRITLRVEKPGVSPYRIFRFQLSRNSSITLRHLILHGGDVSKAAERSDGGVIHLGGHGALTVHQCVIRHGKARRGGGIFAGEKYRQGTLCIESSTITENESVPKSNRAAGGGLYVSFGYAVLRSSDVHDNVSGTHSGGVVLLNTSGEIQDSRIFSNIAADATAVDGTFSGPSLIIVNSTMNIGSSRTFVHAASAGDVGTPPRRGGTLPRRPGTVRSHASAASLLTVSNR
jgi:hypothetical protein